MPAINDGNGTTMEASLSRKERWGLLIGGISLALTVSGAVVGMMTNYFVTETEAAIAHAAIEKKAAVAEALIEERSKLRDRERSDMSNRMDRQEDALQAIGRNVEAIAREQQISRRLISPLPAGLGSGNP